MKKFLKVIGVIILLIIVVVVILGIVEPKDVTVERSLTMNAPQNVVWGQVANFKNWPNWDPWYRMDSTMKIDYSGTDGQQGSNFHWVSNKIGERVMTNNGLDNGTMKYGLTMLKPMKNSSDGWIKTEDAGSGQTKVTWNIHMHMHFPMNAMLAFMDMDKMMGKDFEAGLKNMKEYSEAHAAMGSSNLAIKETQFPGHIYCGVRSTVGWNDMSKYFMDTYGMLGNALQARIIGPAAGLYWSWDTVKHQADMAAVFPVADSGKPVAGAKYFNIPASNACMIAFSGPYNGMMNAHMALMKYCASKNMKVNLVLEEYIKGPHEEKDSTKYLTNIYYLCSGMNGNTAMK